jgi:hypothetical protein
MTIKQDKEKRTLSTTRIRTKNDDDDNNDSMLIVLRD